jgi:hypothetical protein
MIDQSTFNSLTAAREDLDSINQPISSKSFASKTRIQNPNPQFLALQSQKPNKMPAFPEEPLLAPNPDRFFMFLIQYPKIWEMYKKAEASF